jgi:antitoxin ParD1/3/4
VGAIVAEQSSDHGDASFHHPGVAQARALRREASRGGLRFEAFLPPALAAWLLDQIERGVFADPNDAIALIFEEHRELEPHADLRRELLQRTIQAAIDDPRPPIGAEEVDKRLRARIEERQPTAAIWRSAR